MTTSNKIQTRDGLFLSSGDSFTFLPQSLFVFEYLKLTFLLSLTVADPNLEFRGEGSRFVLLALSAFFESSFGDVFFFYPR